MDTPKSKWISVDEAARYYDVPASCVLTLAKDGQVKGRDNKGVREFESADLHIAAELAGWFK